MKYLVFLPLCSLLLLTACTPVSKDPHQTDVTPSPETGSWEEVLAAVRTPVVPAAASEAGPPVREGNRVIFRVRVPEGVEAVYLAGDFNGWGQNTGGDVTNPRFRMQPAAGGMYWMSVELFQEAFSYKYVLQWPGDRYEWISDPEVGALNAEGHSRIELPFPEETSEVSGVGRTIGNPLPPPDAEPFGLRPQRVWATPETPRILHVKLPNLGTPVEAVFRVSDLFGEELLSGSAELTTSDPQVEIPPLNREGGFRVVVEFQGPDGERFRGETVLSSVSRIENDLRYGFFATYPEPAGDYAAKARMLADLYVNAVEYYDYFPAHGDYAPTEPVYAFEPFGVKIHAGDVQRKIKAGHAHNILSLAYVAAYAASESVFRKVPDAMLDAEGRIKIFNGQVMSEEEAVAQGKEKWFWLMNVARGSDWYAYIMDNFRSTLDDSPGDLVSFDGFEVDTYGDPADTRFYSRGSDRDGDLLSEVLRDFMSDVRDLTREVKPHGLVSFNAVNEFGVENMYEVTDFIFMEIWRFYSDRLAELTEMITYHRAPRKQRVVLKLYPADMEPTHSSWPPLTLARVLGATMVGGGSLMVAGEPDEASGTMHGLNSLYYPDHTPMRDPSADLLHRYYRHDALHYGIAHGARVENTELYVDVPGCITRVLAAPELRTLTVRLLHHGGDPAWSSDLPYQSVKQNVPVVLELPAGVSPDAVWYSTPDDRNLELPVEVEFQIREGRLEVVLPRLHVLGTLVIRYP